MNSLGMEKHVIVSMKFTNNITKGTHFTGTGDFLGKQTTEFQELRSWRLVDSPS